MNKQEAAIIMAYTGIVMGDMKVYHAYVEKLLDRAVWTHEFADLKVITEIKEKSRPDFIKLSMELTEE